MGHHCHYNTCTRNTTALVNICHATNIYKPCSSNMHCLTLLQLINMFGDSSLHFYTPMNTHFQKPELHIINKKLDLEIKPKSQEHHLHPHNSHILSVSLTCNTSNQQMKNCNASNICQGYIW